MKSLIKAGLACLLIGTTTLSLADSVIVKDTAGWRSVPIEVDTGRSTYSVVGTAPSSGNYYYSYQGHRCFTEKRDIVGVNALVFQAGVSGGSSIYCYPE